MPSEPDKARRCRPWQFGPNRRRFFRYSLRTAFLLVTLASLLFGWKVNKAHQQRNAVVAVRQMGGLVQYGYERDGKNIYVFDPEPPGPDWLRNLIGIDFFSEVWAVHLRDTQIDDVAPLANLPDLEFLELRNVPVKDVASLAHLQHLEFLHLGNTQVEDVAPLRELARLEDLYLNDTPVADVAPLSDLTSLTHLYLSNTQVSDVAVLAKLTKLTDLDLCNTLVSEKSLQELQQALPNCSIRAK